MKIAKQAIVVLSQWDFGIVQYSLVTMTAIENQNSFIKTV
jgi:hypothetical protein